MKRFLLSLFCSFGLIGLGFGQTTGDFRSFATGDWNVAGTWETFNGTLWVAAGVSPNSTNGAIAIRDGHTITITADLTIDQTTIESGGILTINSGVTVTLGTGSGDDIRVNRTVVNETVTFGILNVNGTIQMVAGISGNNNRLRVDGRVNNNGSFLNATATKLIFQANSNYFHLFDGTTANSIPTASWNATSTVNITGIGPGGVTTPTGLSQTFGNFVWNCPTQDSFLDLRGAPSVVNGNFQIDNTGDGGFYFNQGLEITATNESLTVGGDFIVNGGTTGIR
jgi:hypothetical protein